MFGWFNSVISAGMLMIRKKLSTVESNVLWMLQGWVWEFSGKLMGRRKFLIKISQDWKGGKVEWH